MAKNIRNPKDLEKYLETQAKAFCEFAANEVYEAINFFLAQYYSEWKGNYDRSEQLLHSAFKTKVVKVGNSFQIEVGIDYENLDYDDATGWQVVTWSNTKGIHGGIDVSDQGANTAVYDDAIDSTINSGQLIIDCIKFLQSKGFKVVKTN